MMKHLFSLSFLVFALTSNLYSQNFDLERLDNPSGTFFNSYVGQIDETAFLTYRDVNFNSSLYTFDGEELQKLADPTGLTYAYSDAFTGSEFYLVYDDVNFNDVVVRFDGTNTTPLFEIAPNNFFGGYSFEFNGLPFFEIFDYDFNATLWVFDGTNLLPVTLSNNYFFGAFLGFINGVPYVSLENNFGGEEIFAFNGTDFTPISSPVASNFINVSFQNTNGIYLNVFDANFDASLYLLDGNSLTELPFPAGFADLGGYVGNINGRHFVGLNDVAFNGTIFEIDASNNWVEYQNPGGFSFVFNPGPTESEDKLYPTFSDDQTLLYYMTIFDGNTSTIVNNPSNFEYNDYFLKYKQGHLVSYWDTNFDPRLAFYDNSDFTFANNPSGYVFSTYSFQLGTKLYFRYRNSNFDNTLFSLSLNARPLSADNTINTNRETPYPFSSADFAFTDDDVDNTFQAIQIVDLPTKGILHLFGAPVSPQQEIIVADLEKLYYVPLDNGIGQPYDSLTFKVSDGFNFSAEAYTIYINVNAPVNIEEQDLAEGLTVFPNPASDIVTIRIQEFNSYGPLKLVLQNVNGQLIQSREIDEIDEVLHLQNLAEGIYNLHIYNEKINLSRIVMVSK